MIIYIVFGMNGFSDEKIPIDACLNYGEAVTIAKCYEGKYDRTGIIETEPATMRYVYDSWCHSEKES